MVITLSLFYMRENFPERGAIPIRDLLAFDHLGHLEARHAVEKYLCSQNKLLEKFMRERFRTREQFFYLKSSVNAKILLNIDPKFDWRDFTKVKYRIFDTYFWLIT